MRTETRHSHARAVGLFTPLWTLAVASLAAFALGGCSSSSSSTSNAGLARPGSAPQITMAWKPPAASSTSDQPLLASDVRRPAVLSMAAGDELGMRFYTQSVLIARAQRDANSTVASAQDRD